MGRGGGKSDIPGRWHSAKLDLPADMIATSDDWDAVKPDVPFFRAVIDSAPCDASGIVYVGDQVDNDLKPAKEAACGRLLSGAPLRRYLH